MNSQRHIHLAFERLFELSLRLADRVGDGLEQLGLTRARAELVWRLAQAGPVTHVELSRLLRVSPRNVTGLVDALEADGLVVRQPHPTDRRAQLVVLTDRGRETAERMQEGYQAMAAELLGDLTSGELGRLTDSVGRVLRRLGSNGEAADER